MRIKIIDLLRHLGGIATYHTFSLAIQSAGSFVEQEDFRVAHDCSRDSNALFLNATEGRLKICLVGLR